MNNTDRPLAEVTIKAYAMTEAEAFAHALKIADRKYDIFDAYRVRKVRGELAWNVTFRVRA